MADNQMTENDEDDIVIIEGEAPVEDAVAEDADNSDDDDDDDGDERLGDSEDDSDEEIANKSRSNVKRQKQRERQRRAKEHADRELALLREQNDALLRRVSVIEGNTLASNVNAIDQRIAQAQADVKQATVAQLAGVSVRHMHRLIEQLQSMGILEFYSLKDRRGYRAKTRFILKSLNDSRSHLGQPPNGLPESEHVLKHVMHDDGLEILKFLDFLTEPARSFCAARCTLSVAEQWRQYKDFNDTHELWEALGINKNPVGWIYRMIEAGHPPPALQIPMPGGSLDIPFASRGMTRAEIQESRSPTDGAILGDDGIWR